MLKKIIAAAAASTLAVSALAATASAATTVEFEGWYQVDTIEVTIKADIATGGDLLDVADAKDDSKNNYSKVTVAMSHSFTGDDNEILNVKSGKISAEYAGYTQEQEIKNNNVKWKKGSKEVKATVTDFAIEATALEDDDTIKGDVTAKFDLVKPGNKLGKILAATEEAAACEVGEEVEATVLNKAKITAELTLTLTPEQYEQLTGRTGSDRLWDTAEQVEKTFLSDADKKALKKDGFSVGDKGKIDFTFKKGDTTLSVTEAPDWTITKASVNTKRVIPFDGVDAVYDTNDEAIDWSRSDLRNFMNGGKMTFVFNRSVSGKEWVDGVVMFENGNKQNAILKTDYTENQSALEVEFPANFTYANNANLYPTVACSWVLEKKAVDSLDDLKIVKIIWTANDSAPSNNGGLVEDNNKPANSDNSSTTTPSTPVNSGSNSSDEKNPSTGVAMAVAPVALAAAAAAVVISKKRK